MKCCTSVIRVIRHPGPGSNHPRGSILAIGNFDGLHRGHAELIGQVRDLARAEGRPVAVLTFEPHPRSVFLPGTEPFRLTPFRVKERELARLGVDLLFVQHFDLGFAAKSAEDFIAEVIVGAIGASHVVVGWDCTFGNRRRGSPDLLRTEGAQRGFGVTVLEPIRGEDTTVYSSTHIRELLKAGKPRQAATLLGRFWEIDGRVATGDRRGRTIGFPTANLSLDDYLHPAFGVYAVRVCGDGPDDPLAGHTVDGVANLGLRPTVGGLVPRLEAHLFDVDVDLYGRHLRVALVDFIRPERKFAGLDALKAQIAEDAAQARAILAAAPALE
jgi:riboflavin kinase/FMN adenylyltransferase